MKKIIFILLLVVVAITTEASTDSTRLSPKRKQDISQEELPVQKMPKLIFKAAPLSLLNGYDGPSARVGVEYKLDENLNLYNEIGYFFMNTGAIAKVELKSYLNELYAENKFMSSRDYVSFEFSFKRQEYRTGDSVFVNPGKYYYKDFNVRKSVECFTVKFGTLFVYKGGLTVDLFMGAGIRIRQGCNSLNGEENIKSSSDYSPNVWTNYAGRMVFPNVDIGVKIGFGAK